MSTSTIEKPKGDAKNPTGGNKNKVYTGPRNGKYIIKIVDGKKTKQYIQ